LILEFSSYTLYIPGDAPPRGVRFPREREKERDIRVYIGTPSAISSHVLEERSLKKERESRSRFRNLPVPRGQRNARVSSRRSRGGIRCSYFRIIIRASAASREVGEFNDREREGGEETRDTEELALSLIFPDPLALTHTFSHPAPYYLFHPTAGSRRCRAIRAICISRCGENNVCIRACVSRRPPAAPCRF